MPNVDGNQVMAAFRLAHRASLDAERFDQDARAYFRAIAYKLWQAFGKTGAPSTTEVTK
jgi:hypothetical protein